MGTKTTVSKKLISSSLEGNAMVFVDSVATLTTDVDAADVIQPVRVAAGTEVHRVTTKVSNALAASALTAKIGFTPVDGSAAPSGADTAIKADGAWGIVTTPVVFDIFPPYRVEKDSWLNIVVGTAATTPAAGTVYAKVEGEGLGVK